MHCGVANGEGACEVLYSYCKERVCILLISSAHGENKSGYPRISLVAEGALGTDDFLAKPW